MRLINTRTLQFKDFNLEKERPEYTILSHRWSHEDDEVSYADYLDGRKRGTAGWRKIVELCAESRRGDQRYEWAWIDTCCIDKKDHIELETSLNSMFSWYSRAQVCYVYLHDYKHGLRVGASQKELHDALEGCDWFKRGWTLQELIAPDHMIFYDKQWQRIGTKRSMATALSWITGVDVDLLLDVDKLHSYSIAQKFSWAADRHTGVPEDRAYSMYGILGVQLGTIRGEGRKAFQRLQEYLIDRTLDHTIFAWKVPGGQGIWKTYSVFAPSLRLFRGCGSIVSDFAPMKIANVDRTRYWQDWTSRHCVSASRPRGELICEPIPESPQVSMVTRTKSPSIINPWRRTYAIRNGTLSIDLVSVRIKPVGSFAKMTYFEAALCCYDSKSPTKAPCTILLGRMDGITCRIGHTDLGEVAESHPKHGNHWADRRFTCPVYSDQALRDMITRLEARNDRDQSSSYEYGLEAPALVSSSNDKTSVLDLVDEDDEISSDSNGDKSHDMIRRPRRHSDEWERNNLASWDDPITPRARVNYDSDDSLEAHANLEIQRPRSAPPRDQGNHRKSAMIRRPSLAVQQQPQVIGALQIPMIAIEDFDDASDKQMVIGVGVRPAQSDSALQGRFHLEGEQRTRQRKRRRRHRSRSETRTEVVTKKFLGLTVSTTVREVEVDVRRK